MSCVVHALPQNYTHLLHLVAREHELVCFQVLRSDSTNNEARVVGKAMIKSARVEARVEEQSTRESTVAAIMRPQGLSG